MDKEEIKKSLTLRLATEKDCRKIFFLFNDPEVRKNSLNQATVAYKNHKAWFSKKVHDPNYVFLIAEVNGKFVGQVRYDLENDEALTSVSLHKRFRGYGLGKLLLVKGIDFLKKHHPEIHYATGDIKVSNIAAIKNSEFAGYIMAGKSDHDGEKLIQCRCDLRKE